MKHTTLSVLAAVGAMGLAACGKPLETKEEFIQAAAGAPVPTTAARATGAALRIYASSADQKQLPQPSITVQGPQGGEAVLSVNPVGIVVGLVGGGVLFDMEYRDYSIDGLHYLHGKVSVLANFDYVAALGEDPHVNFQVSFVGDLGISGPIRDNARLNLEVKSNVNDLLTLEGTTKLRFDGKVAASAQTFEFVGEDVVIDWAALERAAR